MSYVLPHLSAKKSYDLGSFLHIILALKNVNDNGNLQLVPLNGFPYAVW